MPTKKYKAPLSHLLNPGHSACAGCGMIIAARLLLDTAGPNTIVTNATGCSEVTTTQYPMTSFKVPWIHSLFENPACLASGILAALKVKGLADKTNIIAIGGDGATFDIGLAHISGMWERGDNVLYVCYDNEAYMNTGIQRSSATPKGAWTNTSQVGSVLQGKKEFKKDLTSVVIAHHIPYVAQATPANHIDLMRKVEKAVSMEGPAFMNILSPCSRGWRFEPQLTIKIAQLAVDTCFWPLFEVENGRYTINYDPGEAKKPISEWVLSQGRYSHLWNNKQYIDDLQRDIDQQWAMLKFMASRAL